jgi:hypothetical protein
MLGDARPDCQPPPCLTAQGLVKAFFLGAGLARLVADLAGCGPKIAAGIMPLAAM